MLLYYLFFLFTIFQRSVLASGGTAVNGCPNLNFDWHMDNQNIIHYTMDVTDVTQVQDNLFEITIHVSGEKQIPLKYLYSLKVIGVNGPKSTVQLYGKNENTYLIDNPTDFTVTFQVYATLTNCQWWMPNFQIQFEYMQGDASQYWQTWIWGTSTFDLGTGCNNYDNQGHSQTDFPGYYWTFGLPSECPSASSIVATSSSTIQEYTPSSIVASSTLDSEEKTTSTEIVPTTSSDIVASSSLDSEEKTTSSVSSATSDVTSTVADIPPFPPVWTAPPIGGNDWLPFEPFSMNSVQLPPDFPTSFAEDIVTSSVFSSDPPSTTTLTTATQGSSSVEHSSSLDARETTESSSTASVTSTTSTTATQGSSSVEHSSSLDARETTESSSTTSATSSIFQETTVTESITILSSSITETEVTISSQDPTSSSYSTTSVSVSTSNTSTAILSSIVFDPAASSLISNNTALLRSSSLDARETTESIISSVSTSTISSVSPTTTSTSFGQITQHDFSSVSMSVPPVQSGNSEINSTATSSVHSNIITLNIVSKSSLDARQTTIVSSLATHSPPVTNHSVDVPSARVGTKSISSDSTMIYASSSIDPKTPEASESISTTAIETVSGATSTGSVTSSAASGANNSTIVSVNTSSSSTILVPGTIETTIVSSSAIPSSSSSSSSSSTTTSNNKIELASSTTTVEPNSSASTTSEVITFNIERTTTTTSVSTPVTEERVTTLITKLSLPSVSSVSEHTTTLTEVQSSVILTISKTTSEVSSHIVTSQFVETTVVTVDKAHSSVTSVTTPLSVTSSMIVQQTTSSSVPSVIHFENGASRQAYSYIVMTASLFIFQFI